MGVLPYKGYYELEKLKRLGGAVMVHLVKSVLPIFSNRLLHIFGPHLFVYFRKEGPSSRSKPTEARQREPETRAVAV
jgi:hypothetical protein